MAKTDLSGEMDLARLSSAAVEAFPSAAERVQQAARESLESAKKTRARVRRERITRQSQQIPAVKVGAPKPPDPPLEMPAEWREDEDTKKIVVEKP